MDIQELQNFRLSDAVKFNDKLNPRLWGSNEKLLPEVREKLLAIAEDFKEFLGVSDLEVKDITISGSNAAYTYTPHSDIDLHLVADLPRGDSNDVYRELFNAKKYQYNDQHDYKIGPYDVELYVQNPNEVHHSQGIYSILNDEWVSVPKRRRPNVNDISTRSKYEDVGSRIEQAIQSGDLEKMNAIAAKIKEMRQAGLDKTGEFGPENLAFKALRTNGLLDQLSQARTSAKDKQLSLDESDKEKPKVKFGKFGGMWFPGWHMYGQGNDGEIDDGDTDGAIDEAQEIPTEDYADIINRFAQGAADYLEVKEPPVIKLRRDPEWTKRHGTFGRWTGDPLNTIELATHGRHILDILRTLAHEMTHAHQNEREDMPPDAGNTGSRFEDEANAMAGRIMRHWAEAHPEMFKDVPLDENINTPVDKSKDLEDYAKFLQGKIKLGRELTRQEQDFIKAYVAMHRVAESPASKTAAATALAACLAAGGCASVRDNLTAIRDVGTVARTAQNMTRAGVNDEARQELKNLIRAQGRTQQNEASGYIPTKAQAKDPRWSMALTKDIRPGQLGKEANKLKLKTDSQGHPQVANPNGLFEKLSLELAQFKKKNKLAESTEQLDEVRMAPSNLMQWARSPEAQGIRAGFEAELIFRDTERDSDDDYEMEPDYDADERCRSLDQVVEFFENDDYGYGLSPRQADSLRENLDEKYYEWFDEEMYSSWKNERDELIRDAWLREKPMGERIHTALVDGLELDDKQADAVEELHARREKGEIKGSEMSEEQLEMTSQYSEARTIAEDVLQEDIQQTIEKQDGFYDEVLDDFRSGFYIDDDSGFFDDVGLRWMSDVANEYDLGWPYMTGGSSGTGSRSWDAIGDSLNGVVDMPVKVSSGYHGVTRREGVWVVEPDSSLEPDDSDDMGLEIVSPPMPLLTALEKLQEVCDWANSNEGNAYTNSSTGLHMGVSVPYKGGDVDYLKLILFLGDEYVLERFGREANTYCKSAMSKFRENIKGGRADPMGAIKLMQHGLLELAHKEIQKGVGDGKYTSAHIQDGYIEFRSPGGDWLAEESADPEVLQTTMLRFARAMSLAANPSEERREYAKKLYKLVAPEGDSQLALFSQYAAGELDKEQLKKRWAEKIIGTEKKMNQRWKLYQNVNGRWEPVPAAEWNGYSENQVKNAVWSKYGREALDTGEYQLVNMGEQDWEVYDVNTGKTLEIVKGKSKGEVADAVYDKYVNQGIGFQVRPYQDPATMTPRAKLAQRIVKPKEKVDWDVVYKPTGRVIDNILKVDKEQAQKLLAQVAVLHDFKNADDLEIRPQEVGPTGDWVLALANGEMLKDYRGDPRRVFSNMSKAEAIRQAKADSSTQHVLGPSAHYPDGRKFDDVYKIVPAPTDTATAQDNTERGEWEFYRTETGNVIDRVNDASRMQANAVRQDIVRRYGHPDASVGMRRVDQQGVRDVAPDVAQNFTQPATYQIFRSGQPSAMNTFQAATHPEAMERLEQFRRAHSSTPPHEFSLRNLPVNENFADGKGPGRPGDSQRHGIPKGATMAELEKASHASGRKGQLARWQLNMRRGHKK